MCRGISELSQIAIDRMEPEWKHLEPNERGQLIAELLRRLDGSRDDIWEGAIKGLRDASSSAILNRLSISLH